jgi:cell division septum initiation protein DivIVA
MKKVIIGIVLIIVVAIGGGVFYVLNNLDSLVKAAIETYGSQATQTAVRVDKVKIDLANGAGAISGLTIANSSGFSMPYAFSLGEIRTGINLQSLQQEPYIIDEITVLAPQVFVEINKDNKTNLNELKKNLTAGMPAKSGSKTETPPAESSAKEPRLIIRRITFADGTIQARAAALDNKEYQLKLPGLDMTNLGGTKGATASELASEILSRLTDRASALVKEKIIDAELDKLKTKANARIDEEKAKLKQMTDEQKQEQLDKAKDKLNNLFNR